MSYKTCILVEQKNDETKIWEPMEGSYVVIDGEICIGAEGTPFHFKQKNNDYFSEIMIGSFYNYHEINSILPSPRGVPVDVSKFFIDYYKSQKNILSCSYLYLKELKEIKLNGYLDQVTNVGSTYRGEAYNLLKFIDFLEEMEIEKFSCHNCIRAIILITY